MNQLSSRTAILFFARSAQEEAQYKHLIVGPQNQELLSILRLSVYQTLSDTGYPVINHSEDQQQGENFGERITHAVSQVFQKGFEKVIVVGSDCPEINPADIHETVQALDQGKTVLGPDARGGLYLFGLNREEFDQETFLHLHWQSESLFSSFAEAASFPLHYLKQKFDLNFSADLVFYCKRSETLKRLIRLLRSAPHIFKYQETTLESRSVRLIFLRGPPLAA